MVLDRLLADEESLGDLGRRCTIGDELENLALAFGEKGVSVRRFGRFVEDSPNVARHRDVSIECAADSGFDLVQLAVLAQIAPCPARQCVPYRHCVDVHREHHDSTSSVGGQDLLQRRDAVPVRHGDVHEDEIGLVLASESNGLVPTVGLTDDEVTEPT